MKWSHDKLGDNSAAFVQILMISGVFGQGIILITIGEDTNKINP